MTEETEAAGLGWQVKFDEWKVMEDDTGRLLLRYKDAACCSHWIAVLQEDDGTEKWVPWWFSPSAANMDDFEKYVLIDLEVVEVSAALNL